MRKEALLDEVWRNHGRVLKVRLTGFMLNLQRIILSIKEKNIEEGKLLDHITRRLVKVSFAADEKEDEGDGEEEEGEEQSDADDDEELKMMAKVEKLLLETRLADSRRVNSTTEERPSTLRQVASSPVTRRKKKQSSERPRKVGSSMTDTLHLIYQIDHQMKGLEDVREMLISRKGTNILAYRR